MANKQNSLRIAGQPSNEELRPSVENYLLELGAVTLTADDILDNETHAAIKHFIMEEWIEKETKRQEAERLEALRLEGERRAEEERQRAELEKQKAAEAAVLFEKMREKRGLVPLTAEELQREMDTQTKLAISGVVPSQKVEIPEDVAALAEHFAGLVPGFVFEDSAMAVTFRGWLGFHIKPINRKLAEPNITAEVRDVFMHRQKDIAARFSAINEVIKAWGLKPGDPATQTDLSYFNEVRSRLEKPESSFNYLRFLPKVETAEEKAAREQAEAEAKAKQEQFEVEQEARKQKWLALLGSLKARLIEVDPKQAEEQTPEQKTGREEIADLMANRIAKKFGDLEDIMEMFKKAAIHRKATARGNESDMETAKWYAKAANMTDEELDLAVNEYHQKHAEEAKAKAAAVAQARQKPNYGEMRPQAPKQKQNDGKKGKGKNNKNQDRKNARYAQTKQ